MFGQLCQMKMVQQQPPMKMDYCINFSSSANDIHKYEHPPKETTQIRMIIRKQPKYVDFKNTFQCALVSCHIIRIVHACISNSK